MSHMFVPGPVDVAPEVLQAMTKPLLPHRSKEYEAIHRNAAEKAQKVFFTDYRVLIGTHSGSGMQECGIRNLVQKDVLSCINGAFSKRCGLMSQNLMGKTPCRSMWNGVKLLILKCSSRN